MLNLSQQVSATYHPQLINYPGHSIDITYVGNQPNYQHIILTSNKNSQQLVYAKNALPNITPLSYFQLQIIKGQSQQVNDQSLQQLNFGLISKIFDHRKRFEQKTEDFQPGIAHNSVGVRANQTYHDSFKCQEYPWKLSRGDVIGIGIIHHNRKVFFTFNGQLLKRKLWLSQNSKLTKLTQKPRALSAVQFYPAVSLTNKISSVKLTFQGNKNSFKFNFDSYVASINKKMRYRIMEESPVSQACLYRFVREYLRFNGYEQSGSKLQNVMREKSMKFGNYSLMKNSSTYNAIIASNIYDEELYKSPNQQKRSRLPNKRDSIVKRPVHLFAYSDDQQIQSQNLEKRIRQLESPPPSSSYSSEDDSKKKIVFNGNIEELGSNIRTYEPKKKNDKLKSTVQKNKQYQCRNQRINIMKCIRQGRIEVAERILLLQKSYIHQKYIKAYFKAHIFLKKYVLEGSKEGLAYLNQQIDEIQKFQNNFFPFYVDSQGQPFILRPLKNILMIVSNGQIRRFDLKKQFFAFAQFIGLVMCRNCGYLQASKLEYAINHSQLIRKYCMDSNIPGTALQIE